MTGGDPVAVHPSERILNVLHGAAHTATATGTAISKVISCRHDSTRRISDGMQLPASSASH
jgi:hypothetical protein